MRLANENKTLKQLLTEPYRVQKKEGYYSYEAFRQGIISEFNHFSVDLQISVEDYLDATIMIAKRFMKEKESMSVRFSGGSLEVISFLHSKEKKIVYLDNNLVEMLANTSPPHSFQIDHFKWHNLLILLPQKYKDKYILFRGLGDKTTSATIPTRLTGGPTQDIFSPTFIGMVTLGKNESVDNSNFFFDPLVVNFLLWQQSMHDKGEEVIELDAPTRQIGFGKNSKQIIVPRVIGEGYKPKVIRNYDPQGTHASPRTHWRSGHWRQQPVGSRKDPKHKTIWVEPVLVNG